MSAYKIQDLDSDLNIAKMASIQGKHKTQQSDQDSEVPVLDPITASMEAMEDHVGEIAEASGDENCPVNKLRKQQANVAIGEILAQIAALTNKLQMLQAKFSDKKNSLDNEIGKAAISAANEAAKNLSAALAKQAKMSGWETFVKVLSYVAEGVGFLFALASGNFILAGVMVALFTAQVSGATSKFQTWIKNKLIADGMSPDAASWVSAGIVCLVEIVVTCGAALAGGLAAAGAQATKTASQAAVKEVAEETIKEAMQKAAKTAVKESVANGVKNGTELADVAKDAAMKAAKQALQDMAKEVGTTAAKSASKAAIKSGLKAAEKECAKEIKQAVSKQAAQAFSKSMNQIIKNGLKALTKEACDGLDKFAKKAMKDLQEDLRERLKAKMRSIAFRQTKGAAGLVAGHVISSTDIMQTLAGELTTWYMDHHKGANKAKTQEIMEIISAVLVALAGLAAGGLGASALGGSGSNFSGLYEDMGESAEEIDQGIYKQVRSMIAKLMQNMMNAPAKVQLAAVRLEAGAQVASSGAEVYVGLRMMGIDQEIAENQPQMEINDSIVRQMNARKAADQKLMETMYKMYPEMLASANSISADIAAAAQALVQ